MSRRRIDEQKQNLKATLRERCQSGILAPGTLAPSLRELAAEFQISKDVVATLRRELVSEGIFQEIPGQGTVIGSATQNCSEFYLMLLPSVPGITKTNSMHHTQSGFENRLAMRGASSLVLPIKEALRARDNDELPPLAGLFDFAFQEEHPDRWGATPGLPRVGFQGRIEPGVISDEVAYNSLEGGRQATRHLWQLGHRRIAFLALHPLHSSQELAWSAQREAGWRETIAANGGNPDLAFHPESEPAHNRQGQIDAGYETARAMLHQLGANGITAVVAANDLVALGLFEALRAEGIRQESWPAVVGFDNLSHNEGWILTSLALPGEELGAAAADLIWERRHSFLTGPSETRSILLRLIPRLSSHANWSKRRGEVGLLTNMGNSSRTTAALT